MRTLGCQSAQGYLFSQPSSPTDLLKLLQENTISIQLNSSTRSKEGQSSIAIALAEIVPSALAESVEQQFSTMVRQTQTLELAIREQEQQIKKQKQIREVLALQVRQEQLAGKIAEQLSRLRQVEEILNFTVTQTHQLLQVDRLIIYRFEPDWRGTIVGEAVTEPWSPLLGLSIEDCCFQEQYVQYYREGRTRTVDDVHKGVLAPCHVGLLVRFEVRSNMVVPILQCESLLGLLIAHQCQQPRHWQQTELVLLNRLAMQLGMAIERAELYVIAHSSGNYKTVKPH